MTTGNSSLPPPPDVEESETEQTHDNEESDT